MSIKQEVLKKLGEERGKVFSGEELAEEFGVSRNAVWKAIKALREDGYEIAAQTNRGVIPGTRRTGDTACIRRAISLRQRG